MSNRNRKSKVQRSATPSGSRQVAASMAQALSAGSTWTYHQELPAFDDADLKKLTDLAKKMFDIASGPDGAGRNPVGVIESFTRSFEAAMGDPATRPSDTVLLRALELHDWATTSGTGGHYGRAWLEHNFSWPIASVDVAPDRRNDRSEIARSAAGALTARLALEAIHDERLFGQYQKDRTVFWEERSFERLDEFSQAQFYTALGLLSKYRFQSGPVNEQWREARETALSNPSVQPKRTDVLYTFFPVDGSPVKRVETFEDVAREVLALAERGQPVGAMPLALHRSVPLLEEAAGYLVNTYRAVRKGADLSGGMYDYRSAAHDREGAEAIVESVLVPHDEMAVARLKKAGITTNHANPAEREWALDRLGRVTTLVLARVSVHTRLIADMAEDLELDSSKATGKILETTKIDRLGDQLFAEIKADLASYSITPARAAAPKPMGFSM